MLVLSRKTGQTIEFGELDVVVRVLGVKGSRVQLGIEAPKEISIERPERRRGAPECPPSGNATSCPIDSASEMDRLRDELAHVEAGLASLAELADTKNRPLARQVAAESIGRIKGIRRSLRLLGSGPSNRTQPIGALVRVRAEVLQRLRKTQQVSQVDDLPTPGSANETASVRESRSGYAVDRVPTVTCTVA